MQILMHLLRLKRDSVSSKYVCYQISRFGKDTQFKHSKEQWKQQTGYVFITHVIHLAL